MCSWYPAMAANRFECVLQLCTWFFSKCTCFFSSYAFLVQLHRFVADEGLARPRVMVSFVPLLVVYPSSHHCPGVDLRRGSHGAQKHVKLAANFSELDTPPIDAHTLSDTL